jgi:hypothetical protein
VVHEPCDAALPAWVQVFTIVQLHKVAVARIGAAPLEFGLADDLHKHGADVGGSFAFIIRPTSP